MQKVIDAEKCFACGACLNVCPKNAIDFKTDKYGFFSADIDEEKCIDCHLCIKVCPAISSFNGREIGDVYAATLKNKEEIKKCASGGAFSAIAHCVLDKGGVIVGCAFDSEMMPHHIIVDKENALDSIRSSKYVQSYIGEIHKEIKDNLNAGRLTLFSGTPCQVAGLLGCLGKEYSNLITCDLICHGVPSSLLWKDYLAYEEHKLGEKIDGANFRSKKRGWGPTILELKLASGKVIYRNSIESSYYHMFLKGACYRDSCYTCPFSNSLRAGDFTIGDFWGVKEENPKLFSRHGVSVISFNTEKAENLREEISQYTTLNKIEISSVQKHNRALREPVAKQDLGYLEAWKAGGFEAVDVKYDPIRRKLLRASRKREFKTNIKFFLRKINFIKKNKV